jgi:Protein of unknown function (DUF3185)
MRPLLSVLAVMGGLWLLYLGYERQISLAGRTDRTFSRMGTAIDGGDHTPLHTKYFVAGAVLLACGSVGLGFRR